MIGGWVAQAYVASYVTEDVDFTPANDPGNLERLSAALTELGARIRTAAVPEGLPSPTTQSPSVGPRCGISSATMVPSISRLNQPGGGYDYLAGHAHLVNVRGIEIPVADLADVIASKRLANRPKDQLVLPHLDQALIDRDDGPGS
jgi:hypothetical protein